MQMLNWENLLPMGIQYFVSVSEEKLAYQFLTTDDSKIVKIRIIQGCWEQPDLDFLIFMQ
jgi:hypothetical protein